MQDPWLCFPQVWGHLATRFLLAGPFGMDGERLYYKHADQLAVNTCPVSCPAENWLPRGLGSPVTQPGWQWCHPHPRIARLNVYRGGIR